GRTTRTPFPTTVRVAPRVLLLRVGTARPWQEAYETDLSRARQICLGVENQRWAWRKQSRWIKQEGTAFGEKATPTCGRSWWLDQAIVQSHRLRRNDVERNLRGDVALNPDDDLMSAQSLDRRGQFDLALVEDRTAS